MKPSELFQEKARKPGLYNIMPLSNIRSVLEYGILSNEKVETSIHCHARGPKQARSDSGSKWSDASSVRKSIAFDYLDYDLIYATNWRDEDYFEYCRKKSTKCAEVLVPEFIPPDYHICCCKKCF